MDEEESMFRRNNNNAISLLSKSSTTTNGTSSTCTFRSLSSLITKNAIKRMLYYPYNKNNATTTTKKQNLRKFQPIVQVVDIIKRQEVSSIDPDGVRKNENDNNNNKKQQTNIRRPCYGLILSDSKLTIKAYIYNSKSVCPGEKLFPRRNDIKQYMFITIHDFIPISTCNDGHYLILKSYSIHSYYPASSSSSSLLRQPNGVLPISVDITPNRSNMYILNVAAQYKYHQPIHDYNMIDSDDEDVIGSNLWSGHGCRYEGAIVIAQTIQQYTDPASTLSILDLSYNFLGNTGIELVVQSFPSIPMLQNLILSYNDISYKGIVALVEYMKLHNTNLRQLKLDNNRIGDRALTILAEALQVGRYLKLQELYLDDNKMITVKGIQTLSTTVLTTNQSLKILSLRSNNIGNEGMIAIATSLKYNMTLEVLYLQMTNIGNDGLVALADAIKYNIGLKEINISHNVYNEIGALAIYRALEYNPVSLCTLKLDARQFDSNNYDIIGPRKYNTAMIGIIQTMLRDYNDTLQQLDDPMLPLSIQELLKQQQQYNDDDDYYDFYYYVPDQKYCKKKGQHQRMDMYQWLLTTSLWMVV